MARREIQDTRELRLIKALKTARKAAGLSQIELAARLGKRQQFVSKYESAERRLDFIEVLDVAQALGLSAETLLEEVCDLDASS